MQTETQPQSAEPTTPVETPTEKPDELSPKFAALAKKERALRAQMQAIKQKEDAMKAQETEYQTKYVPKERLLKETLAVLQEQGITYDQLTGMILNQPSPQDQATTKLEAKIEALEKQLLSYKEETTQSQTKAYDQALNQIRNEAKILVDSDQAYETIKETNNTEAIVALIEEHYKETGLVMSTLDAAKQVEDYLVEEALKMAGLSKVKAKLTPQEVIEEQKPQVTQKQQIKTLTNSINATTKPLTAKDRRERAILAAKGLLKN